jgi:hypothetical protein
LYIYSIKVHSFPAACKCNHNTGRSQEEQINNPARNFQIRQTRSLE